MAEALYYLTDLDLGVLRELIERELARKRNDQFRDAQDDLSSAPGGYLVMAPEGGIPPASEYGGKVRPGAALCKIQYLSPSTTSDLTSPMVVKETHNRHEYVFNHTGQAITGGQVVLVDRDRYGKWFVLGGGDGSFWAVITDVTDDPTEIICPEEGGSGSGDGSFSGGGSGSGGGDEPPCQECGPIHEWEEVWDDDDSRGCQVTKPGGRKGTFCKSPAKEVNGGLAAPGTVVRMYPPQRGKCYRFSLGALEGGFGSGSGAGTGVPISSLIKCDDAGAQVASGTLDIRGGKLVLIDDAGNIVSGGNGFTGGNGGGMAGH